MRLQIKGTKIDVSPALKKLAETRLAKIERVLNDALVSAHLVLAREKSGYVVDLTVHAKGDHILHGVGNTAAWGTSLTVAVQKVMQQAETIKGKWLLRKKGAPGIAKRAAREPRR
jgi:ribosomal subunit interface protein